MQFLSSSVYCPHAVGMSVAGWFIRKNLLKEGTTSTSGADPSINDGTRLEEEEQQHLLA